MLPPPEWFEAQDDNPGCAYRCEGCGVWAWALAHAHPITPAERACPRAVPDCPDCARLTIAVVYRGRCPRCKRPWSHTARY